MSENFSDVLSDVIKIIGATGNVMGLTPDQDFYDAGVTSVLALPILLELEDQFQVSIPDDLFIAARTARAMADVITKLQQG